MENDRELLEYAAKAAGIDIRLLGTVINGQRDRVWLSDIAKWDSAWNPLTDDGDALRLAVKLRLANKLMFPDVSIIASEQWVAKGGEIDWYAATRRAIVRAAAEIGKQINGT